MCEPGGALADNMLLETLHFQLEEETRARPRSQYDLSCHVESSHGALSYDLDAIYKAAKVHVNGDVKGKGSTVEDVNEDDDTEAGPAIPQIDDDPADDEEGRFFGGGITNDTSDILDYMDQQPEDDVAHEKYDSTWLRKVALNFKKRISKNAELRAKFESDPGKFMGSEADLDTEIKALSILSEHPELYEDFAKLGCVSSLVNLLSHENTDISIGALEIISELTDEDVEAQQPQWDSLVDAMLDADVLNLLTQNFARFDESQDADKNGVYHALSVLENLVSRTTISEKIGSETTVLSFLLQRAQARESPVSQNKQYAAEVLAILLQSTPANRKRLVELDGVDMFLQILASYRKRDPAKGSDEEEFVENIFDCLTCVVDDAEGKEKFVAAEGAELCLIMLREGKMSKPRSLRLLDHAAGGLGGKELCDRLIEAAGLKTLFSLFMKKVSGRLSLKTLTHALQQESRTTEHILGVFASFLRLLPADSAERIRVLAKFVEKDYEKIAKLVKMRREYASKVSVVDRDIIEERQRTRPEDQGGMEDEWLSRRLDAGLYSLQTIDVILAWLLAEDDGSKRKIQSLLSEQDQDFAIIKATLREQLNTTTNSGEEASQTRDMLTALMRFVEP
ncbi:MAG: hypothetical protein M1833_003580 [Piccolia ochrophora]|nr:MAG: hypothetical protein M1833_003580 [Piccolia ochrophora]